MQGYDIIMLVVVGVAALLGYRKGLVWQVASVCSIVVSYFVAYRFHSQLAAHINVGEPWNKFLSMLILYLGASLVIWFLFRLVRGVLDRAKLKDFDQHLGALFGAVKGVLLCVVITLFAVTLLGDQLSESIVHSRSGYYIARLLDHSTAMVPPELHERLSPLLQKLDERFEVTQPREQDSPYDEFQWDRQAARPADDAARELPRRENEQQPGQWR